MKLVPKKITLVNTGYTPFIFAVIGPFLCVPFVFSYYSTDPSLLPQFIGLGICLFFLLLSIWFQFTIGTRYIEDFYIIRTPFFIVTLVFLIIAAQSTFKAIEIAEGLFVLLKHFMTFIFVFLITIFIGEKESNLHRLIRSIVVLGFMLGVVGVCQYHRIAFTFIPGNYLIYGTMTHKNLLAEVLFLTLPFISYTYFFGNQRWRVFSFATGVFAVYDIFLCRSRTVWIALAVSTLLTVVVFFIRFKWRRRFISSDGFPKSRKIRRLVLPAAIVLLFSIFGFWQAVTGISISGIETGDQILLQTLPYKESVLCLNTLSERFWLWQQTSDMIKKHPLYGVGLGQWRIIFPLHSGKQTFRVGEDKMDEIYFQRPHNDFLLVLAEMGFIGFLFYLSLFVILLYNCLKLLFNLLDIKRAGLAGFLFGGIIGYLVISMFSFPSERITQNILIAAIMGCSLSIYGKTFQKPKLNSRIVVHIVLALGVILVAGGAGVGYVRLHSEKHAAKALTAFRAKNWETVVEEINKASSIFYRLDPTSTPLTWLRGVGNYSLKRYGEAHEDFIKAYRDHPYHIHVLNNLGTSYAQTGDFEKAVEYYKKALEIWPGFTEAQINIGVIYFHTGNFKRPGVT